MVTRHYICNSCGHQFTVMESIQDCPRQQCPQCQGSLFQDLTGQIHIIIGEPTTVGQQAERNSKALGKYGLEAQQRKDRKEFEERKLKTLKKMGKIDEGATEIPEKKPWYNPTGTNLKRKLKTKLKDKTATRKYILEGK